MLIVITGGSGSGKSSYAEERVLSFHKNKKYYLATMQVYGEEGLAKVNRHRALRASKGFETIEKQTRIHEVTKQYELEDSVILLECMSNLVANEMFQEEKMVEAEQVIQAVLSGIEELCQNAETLIVVTNNVFEDGVIYDEGTTRYLQALGRINEKMAEMADEVVEVVVGIPVLLKGGMDHDECP